MDFRLDNSAMFGTLRFGFRVSAAGFGEYDEFMALGVSLEI